MLLAGQQSGNAVIYRSPDEGANWYRVYQGGSNASSVVDALAVPYRFKVLNPTGGEDDLDLESGAVFLVREFNTTSQVVKPVLIRQNTHGF
jgi:hypothetical protein